MIRIFVLSVYSLVTISTVQSRTTAKNSEHPEITAHDRMELEKCAREYNVGVQMFDKPFEFEEQLKNPTNETCVAICAFKKQWSNPKTSLYEMISYWIRTVYDDGFQSPTFSRKDIESKVQQCHIQAPSDCEFFKCVGIASPPISEIFGHVIQKLTGNIIEALGNAMVNSTLSS